ncbi:exopolysaccharide biosynthesis protein [Sphingosinicella humi]|uniref:Exopolysaccharide biosynthesis protein n=2 Tax=Allosphingosinicella humi TaxID=2068657 RepID=A0A2U2J1A4_9SPHN|nr:exopolysaccharide biosynthesis protein [Sphingosinicella humi]
MDSPAWAVRVANEPLLRQYWRVILRRKWIIGGVIAASLLVALIVTLLMTPMYTATATIEIAREDENIVNIEGIKAESTSSAADLEFYQTQYSLLEARSLAERVAEDLQLSRNAVFFETFGVNPMEGGLFGEANDPNSLEQRRERQKKAVDVLLDHVEISPIRGSSLVEVSFTSPDPALSRRIVNSWTEHFIGSNLDRRFEATSYARKFLEDRLEQLRQRLEASERQLVAYAAQQGIINVVSEERGAAGSTVRERSLLSEELLSLSNELAKSTADRIRAGSLVNGDAGASARALENDALNMMRQKRAEAAAEYSNMMATFGPDYPPAQALEQELAALERSITAEEARVAKSISGEYQNALRREQVLASRVGDLKRQMIDLQRRNIQYNIFQRDVDTNRELYNGLLQRYKEVGIAGGVGTNNISIVDPAILPEEPSSPNLILNLLMALIGGCIVAAGIVLALEQIDEAVKEPADVVGSLGTAVLGVIPSSVGDPLDYLQDRKSDIAEAYLSLQTSLQFSTDHGVPGAIAVSSTRAAEGKSTTAYAIAQSLARTGRSVVLIDADMRSPSIAHMTNVPNDKGVSNFLAGDDDLDRFIRKPEGHDFAVIAAGPNPPNAAELLTGARLNLLLSELLKRFDHVVVDSPPVLGLADAPLIGSKVEGVVYTVEAGAARTSMVRSALNRLAAANANVLGIVLTKFEAKRAGYGYGYGYDYGYGYGKDKANTA